MTKENEPEGKSEQLEDAVFGYEESFIEEAEELTKLHTGAYGFNQGICGGWQMPHCDDLYETYNSHKHHLMQRIVVYTRDMLQFKNTDTEALGNMLNEVLGRIREHESEDGGKYAE